MVQYICSIISGWWWLEPWNFKWLSRKIGNLVTPSDELHHFSEGWLNHQPVSHGLILHDLGNPLWLLKTQIVSCRTFFGTIGGFHVLQPTRQQCFPPPTNIHLRKPTKSWSFTNQIWGISIQKYCCRCTSVKFLVDRAFNPQTYSHMKYQQLTIKNGSQLGGYLHYFTCLWNLGGGIVDNIW